MIADSMPIGPRRTAVAKAEVEVTVAEEKLDLAIFNRDWVEATALLSELRAAREARDEILDMWILQVPGAEEFFNPKEPRSGDTK